MDNFLPFAINSDTFRSRAENIIRERKPHVPDSVNESELKNILFELEVRGIELELLREEYVKSVAGHNRLFNTLPMGIVYQDRQGNIISANQSAAEILGLTIDQLMGRTSFDPRWKALYEDGTPFPGDQHPATIALHSGKTVRDVVMGIFNPVKEGMTWIRIDAVPLFMPEQSEPYQVYTTFNDITMQKQIEKALRESEEQLRLITDITIDYFFKLDVAEDYSVSMSYVSGNHNAATGRTFDDVKEMDSWTSIIHPEDFSGMISLLKQLVSSGGSGDIECRTYRPDKSIRWVHIYAKALRAKENGRVVSILGAVKDINNQKKAEDDLRAAGERWESTFNAISELITILDNNYRIVQCNRAMIKYSGIPKDEIIGMNCHEIFHTAKRPQPGCAFAMMQADCLEHSEEIYSEILGRYYLVTVSPVFNAAGHLAGCVHAARDITERKQYELSLIESEVRYRELFNNISSGVVIYEAKNNGDDFIIRDLNRAGEHIEFTRKQEILGKSISEVWPGVKEFGLLDVLKRVFRTGVPEYFPEHLYTDNRISAYFENFVYKLPSGELVAVFDNVTERKNAQIALEEETELLRLTMNSIGDGVITLDIDGRITTMNIKAEQITGRPLADILHNEFLSVFTIMNEETQEKIANPVDIVTGTGNIAGQGNRFVIIRSDGARRIITYTGSPIRNNAGKLLGVVIIFHDITEREEAGRAFRKSEQRYRDLINTLQEGVWVIDKDAYTVFVNPRMEILLGYMAEEMIGKHIFTFIDENDIADCRQKLAERKNGLRGQYEFRLKKKDGSQLLALFESGPLYDADGNYAGAISGIMDITELKQMQNTLVAREKELLHLTTRLMQVREEERNRIARNLHDDIGHMVTMIKMNLFLLEKTAEQQGVRGIPGFRELKAQVDGLIESIQRISLEIRPAVLYDLGLPEALRFYTRRFEKQTNIKCNLNIPPDIKGLQNESAIALYRIIQEAFVNVYRHANATEITLDLDCPEDYIRLIIRDNGKGIQKDKILHINSLGILGMRERTLFLKGILNITGREGEGTTLTLTFPLVKKEEAK